jgi:hypothetical protein
MISPGDRISQMPRVNPDDSSTKRARIESEVYKQVVAIIPKTLRAG